jgi:hypothetical protein
MYGRRPDPPPIPTDIEKISKDKQHATLCRQFLNYAIRYNTTKRAELERGWNRYRSFDMGKQWLIPARTSLSAGRLWFAWEPLELRRGQSPFPRPVYNIFSPAMQEEVARLVKVGTKPYMKADDPQKADAAILAKNVLTYRNNKTGWRKQNRLGCYQMAMFGQWIEMSRWETNFLNTWRAPATGAVQCENFPGCDYVLAEQQIPTEVADQMSSRNPASVGFLSDGEGPTADAYAARCPRCNGNLVEADLPRDYYLNKEDVIGRPLTRDQALGEDVTEVMSCYSAFPANQGVGYQTAEDMEEIAFRTPRSVPYLRARYENAADLTPMVDVSILEHHPSVAGGWGLSPGHEGLWNNHRVEDLYIMKPTKDFPKGMLIAMSGDRLLNHAPLLMPGTDIPRIEVGWAQWELRENEVWGKPLSEDMASLQTQVNSSLAQGHDIMQKFTSPKVMLHEGMALNFQGGANSNFPGDVWTMNTRGIPPDLAKNFPHFFGNTGVPESIFKMLEIAKDQVPDVSGARAPEIGNVSGAELNYSALLFAAQKSAERRGPRTQDLRDLKVAVWNHRLRCIASFYREDRLVEFQDERDQKQVKYIRGLQLQNQTTVTLEDEPIVDSGVARRASITQAISMGTLRTSVAGGTYSADRKINRAIDLPEELNEDRNVQDDRAHAEWRDLAEYGTAPFVDRTSDDHTIHYQNHDLAMSGREGRQLKQQLVGFQLPTGRTTGPEYGWTEILRITWRWEEMFNQLLTAQQLVKTADPPQVMLQKLTAIGANRVEAAGKVQQAMQQLAMAQKMLGAGGTPFPQELELQIEEVFVRMLEAAGLIVIEPLAILTRFNAHRLAHWKLLQQPVATGTPPPPGAGAGAAAGAAPAMRGPNAPPASIDAAQASAA